MNIAAIGIVLKDQEILLVKRRFPPVLWSPPGGFLDPGEEPEETVQREVCEETGIDCEVIGKIHEFTHKNSKILVYACQYISGYLQCSFESTTLGWFDIEELPAPISPDVHIFKSAITYLTHR